MRNFISEIKMQISKSLLLLVLCSVASQASIGEMIMSGNANAVQGSIAIAIMWIAIMVIAIIVAVFIYIFVKILKNICRRF